MYSKQWVSSEKYNESLKHFSIFVLKQNKNVIPHNFIAFYGPDHAVKYLSGAAIIFSAVYIVESLDKVHWLIFFFFSVKI